MLRLQTALIHSLMVLSAPAIDAVQAQEQGDPLAAGPPGFLSAESDFWAPYGVTLSRDSKEIGPGFLALELDDAVQGSAEAQAHAGHAQVWAGIGFGAGLAAAGLLVADLLTYPGQHDGSLSGWPDFAPIDGSSVSAYLGIGWFVCLGLAVVSRYMTYEEILLSTNAYNRDLVHGRLLATQRPTAIEQARAGGMLIGTRLPVAVW